MGGCHADRLFTMMDSQTPLTAYATVLFGLIHESRDLGRPGARGLMSDMVKVFEEWESRQ